jgi:hypothetical protein
MVKLRRNQLGVQSRKTMGIVMYFTPRETRGYRIFCVVKGLR